MFTALEEHDDIDSLNKNKANQETESREYHRLYNSANEEA